jgi:DNA-binding CsgD family transcriptional regulator
MVMPMMSTFTPTERRIMEILIDGSDHHKEELAKCMEHDTELRTLAQHISNMRKKLRPKGFDILLSMNGKLYYRCVRLLSFVE